MWSYKTKWLRSYSCYITTLPGLVAIGVLVVEYNVFSLSRDQARPHN